MMCVDDGRCGDKHGYRKRQKGNINASLSVHLAGKERKVEGRTGKWRKVEERTGKKRKEREEVTYDTEGVFENSFHGLPVFFCISSQGLQIADFVALKICAV